MFDKWKVDWGRELIRMKKLNLKKEREIQTLRRQKNKHELIAKKKTQDLSILAKKQHQDEKRRKQEINQVQSELKAMKKWEHKTSKKAEPTPKPNNSVWFDIKYVKSWIEENVEKIITLRRLQKDLNSHYS